MEVGDIIKVGPDHFIKASHLNEKGELIWSSDFSTDEKEEGTLKQVVKNLEEGQYGKKGEGQDLSLKNATLYRRKGKDRVRENGKPLLPIPLKQTSPPNEDKEHDFPPPRE